MALGGSTKCCVSKKCIQQHTQWNIKLYFVKKKGNKDRRYWYVIYYELCLNVIKEYLYFYHLNILRGQDIRKKFGITWVWLIPKFAANSARSGRARYCVRWKRLSRCWVWSDEYIDLGFRIFLPLPLTRVVISPFSIVYVAPEIEGVSTVLSL